MIFSITVPAYAYKSYLVYAGQSDDGDADAFKAKLDANSAIWTSNTLKTNNNGAVPGHNDLTDYPDDTIGARLLYYSGHGFHDGFIPFFKQDLSPVKTYVNGVLTSDLLRFDGSWTHTNNADMGYPFWWPCDHPASSTHPNPYFEAVYNTLKPADWAVGAHYLTGSTTKTESRWDNNIKHVFLTACSLLNDQNNEGYNPADP